MEPGRQPLCSIVILNWNKPDYTIECYNSILRQEYSDYEILIIDNASTDDSLDRFRKECGAARIILNPVNGGTGGGFAFGAGHARGEYILFLCNDTVLEPDALGLLVDVMTGNPDCGACGAKHLYYDRPDTVELLGYVVDRFGMQHCFGSDEPDDGRSEITERWISGTVFMTSRAAYEQAGGYDPVHFTLNDEVDLCWRLRIHGWRLLNCSGARVRHRHFATLKTEGRARTRYWAERHLVRTMLKNYSGWTLLWILPQYAVLALLQLAYLCCTGMPDVARADLRAFWWNLRMLPDTWRHHRRIQRGRTIPDREFRRTLWPGCIKLEWGLQLLKERRKLGACRTDM